MNAEKGCWESIGTIRTPHKVSEGMPIQPFKAAGIRGIVELEPRFCEALKDLEGFERIWLIYLFHKSNEAEPVVVPYMDDRPRGLFSTRAPSRFNPIGLSAVKLLRIEENRLEIEDVDMLEVPRCWISSLMSHASTATQRAVMDGLRELTRIRTKVEPTNGSQVMTEYKRR